MTNEEIFGWFKFPEPEGTKYGQKEFEDKDKLLELFNYCQQGLGFVKDKGWQFLIVELGIQGILELDAQSGWLKSTDKGEWLSNVFFQIFTSGYDPQADDFGDYDIETKTFIYNDNTARKIDWDEVYEFSKQL